MVKSVLGICYAKLIQRKLLSKCLDDLSSVLWPAIRIYIQHIQWRLLFLYSILLYSIVKSNNYIIIRDLVVFNAKISPKKAFTYLLTVWHAVWLSSINCFQIMNHSSSLSNWLPTVCTETLRDEFCSRYHRLYSI